MIVILKEPVGPSEAEGIYLKRKAGLDSFVAYRLLWNECVVARASRAVGKIAFSVYHGRQGRRPLRADAATLLRVGFGEESIVMPLRWLILVLAMVLLAMMAVVLLRAETTRLHYELSQFDRRAEVLRQELREKELELARLRNPALIRAKLDELRLGGARTLGVHSDNP